MAQKELRQEKQVGGPVNCSDSELCTFLRGLEEGFLPTYYSDTSPSVQSKSMNIASKSYQLGKKTVVFHGFPSLQMSRSSTDGRGTELLTWFPVSYTHLDVYKRQSVQCDNLNHVLPVRAQFTGPNKRYCWKEAREARWFLHKDGSAMCPRCWGPTVTPNA